MFRAVLHCPIAKFCILIWHLCHWSIGNVAFPSLLLHSQVVPPFIDIFLSPWIPIPLHTDFINATIWQIFSLWTDTISWNNYGLSVWLYLYIKLRAISSRKAFSPAYPETRSTGRGFVCQSFHCSFKWKLIYLLHPTCTEWEFHLYSQQYCSHQTSSLQCLQKPLLPYAVHVCFLGFSAKQLLQNGFSCCCCTKQSEGQHLGRILL